MLLLGMFVIKLVCGSMGDLMIRFGIEPWPELFCCILSTQESTGTANAEGGVGGKGLLVID